MSSFAIDFSGPEAPINWNSIYVKNIHPKQMREELAGNFTIFGEISRIDVVEFKRPNGLTGKNAFIHFLNWRDNNFSRDTRANLEAQFAKKREDPSCDQNGVQYEVGRSRYFLFINEKPISMEPMNLHQLTIGNRQLEAILLEQRKIVAAHEERITRLEFELSEMDRLFKGRGISERSMSAESSDIQVVGQEMIDRLNSQLSEIPEEDMMRIVYGPGGKPLNNGESMHISELDITEMNKNNE
jgi:hypothetical protein